MLLIYDLNRATRETMKASAWTIIGDEEIKNGDYCSQC